MNELDMKPLDLWKHVQELSVDEFMCLLFGLEPEAMKFDYGNPTDWPKNADLIYRMLTEDLQAKKLHVFFDDIGGDPFYNGAYDKFYAGSTNPWWAACDGINCVGKIQRAELVKWLKEKEIPSEFFGVPASKEESRNAIEMHTPGTAAQSSKYTDDSIKAPAPPKVKKKYRRGTISASMVANVLGVSERQVRNWDKGIHTPDGYPGRIDEMAFQLFVNQWRKTQILKSQARAMNKPVSGGGIADYEARTAFDDENDEAET